MVLPVNDSVEEGGEEGGGPTTATRERGARASEDRNETRNTSRCRYFIPNEADYDHENEDVIDGRKMVYLWECRRGGFAPLTAKELDRINTQAALGSALL